MPGRKGGRREGPPIYQISHTFTFYILRRALGLLFSRPVQVLRLAVLPGLVAFLGSGVLVYLMPITDSRGMSLMWDLALVAVLGGAVVWFAIGWHRLHLSDQPAGGWVARYPPGLVVRYIALSIAILLLGYCTMLVVLVLVGRVFPQVLQLPGVLILSGLGFYLSVCWISLRLCLVLPAAALGNRLGLRQSWRLTGAAGAGFVPLAFVMTLVELVSRFVGNVPKTTLLGDLIGFGFVVFSVLFWLAVFTTLYAELHSEETQTHP